MSQVVVGLKPWLPGFLARWPAWTEPVRAERLALLRIGTAAVLLLDILTNYLPHLADLFGPNSLGDPDVFWHDRPGSFWSLLAWAPSPAVLRVAALIWAGTAVLLLLGLCSRASAAVAWALSQSFLALNPYAHNAGDTVRTMILLYLMLSPCGAVWSLDRRLQRHRPSGPILVYPWPLRLLLVQMAVIYFYNGVHKLIGPQWQAGSSLYYVLNDLTLTRWSYAELPLPFVLTQLLTWGVLAWELAFPLLVLLPSTRPATLVMGVLLHVGIGLSMELGAFAPYMLCLYLPFVPERFWSPTTSRCAPRPRQPPPPPGSSSRNTSTSLVPGGRTASARPVARQ
jgi:hypothetical protein